MLVTVESAQGRDNVILKATNVISERNVNIQQSEINNTNPLSYVNNPCNINIWYLY